MKKRLKSKAFPLRLAAFSLMMLVPIALFFTAQAGSNFWAGVLLGLIAAASVLLILIG